jgi:serine/threonine protein kinase
VTGRRQNFLNANLRLEWAIEFFDALAFIHSKQIVHRDLSPGNVYLFTNNGKHNRMSIKIGDFGWSRQKKTLSDFNSYGGTFHYQSPEIVSNSPYSFKTDVW